MSGLNLQNDDFDEMDEVMSQIETDSLYGNRCTENGWQNGFDAVDELISQIDTNQIESHGQDKSEASNQQNFDEMDEVMSQIDMNAIEGAFELVEYCGDSDFDDGEYMEDDGDAEYLDEYDSDDEMLEMYLNQINEASESVCDQPTDESDANGGENAVGSTVAEEITPNVPADMLDEYQKALDQLLPNKSASRYLQAYETFRKWQNSRNTSSFDEKVLLVYFSEAATKYKPSTLWSMYSMLKKTLICKHNVDISKISALVAFLKTKSAGFKSRKSNVFSAEEVQAFMVQAPNIAYLGMKAVAAMGVIGGLRTCEMTNLTDDDVRDNGEEIVVLIPDTKTKDSKFFTIEGEMAELVRQYRKLRPENLPTKRFFIQYRKGRCTSQVMGKNSIAKVPKEVAKFLGLPNYLTFTGHGLRRTSTTLLADSGAPMEDMKRHGPWKSNAVCEGYIQNSMTHKRKIGRLISNAINLPSTSKIDGTLTSAAKIRKLTVTAKTSSQIQLSSEGLSDQNLDDFSFDVPDGVASLVPRVISNNPPPSSTESICSADTSSASPGNVCNNSSATAISSDSSTASCSSSNTSVASSIDGIINALPFPHQGNIIFQISGQISNFNVNMKQ